MKQSWRLTLAATVMVGVGLIGFTLVDSASAQAPADKGGKAPAAAKGGAKGGATKGARPYKTAGETFKNVTTGPLKDLSVDDFIAAMGVLTDDLGLDCADCHPGAGSDHADFVIDTKSKITARKMIEMVGTINRANFNGVQKVTCWTCHHGRDIPATTIALETVYDSPNKENDDIVQPDRSQPTPAQVFEKYYTALGGKDKVAAVNSFVATGQSIGYEGLGGNASFTIYSQKPNKRTTLIQYKDTSREDSAWAFNGTTGWIKTPRALVGEYEVYGGERDGMRFEAQLAFPTDLATQLTGLHTGPMQSIGDRDFTVVQGYGQRNLLVTLYFDASTGLLARMVRYSPGPIGRMPTQIDYSDYKDVNGVKFPFTYTFLWLDGRYTAKISDVKTNVAIDAALFGQPTLRKK